MTKSHRKLGRQPAASDIRIIALNSALMQSRAGSVGKVVENTAALLRASGEIETEQFFTWPDWQNGYKQRVLETEGRVV